MITKQMGGRRVADFSAGADGSDVAPGMILVDPLTGQAEPTQVNFASAASVNAQVLKGSPGRLKFFTLSNYNAGTRYLKLYDKASAPTVGTDLPIVSIPLGAGGTTSITPAIIDGYKFSNGIAIAVTGAFGELDATAIGARDVVGPFVFY